MKYLIFIVSFLTLMSIASAANLLPTSNILKGYSGQMNPGVSASIASGQTTSAAISLGGFSLVGILTPAALTGTAFTFTVSADGTTYVPLYNSAGAVSYTVAASRYIAINPVDFYGVKFLKIVSGSSEAATRALTLSVKGL
jgi:hypothetical protein